MAFPKTKWSGGETIPASWPELVQFILEHITSGSPELEVIVNSDGSINLLLNPGLMQSVALVKLDSRVNDTTYIGRVFANGEDLAASDAAAVIRVTGVAAGESLRFGIPFYAARQPWADIDNPASRKKYWTIINPELLR